MSTVEDIQVLIIGAGINGAGLFRDLCAQGVVCAIVDKADFGSGTSAAPSRLIHGGIKYLETGELGLVAQSTKERNLLLKNAPHAVSALPTVIPIFSWLNGIPAAIRTLFGSTTAPRSRGAVLIKIGLLLYDFYGSRHRVMPRHSMWSRSTALANIPPLTPQIVAAGLYYDAKIVHPERLVLELVEDGVRAEPRSFALNYAEIENSDGETVTLRDAHGVVRGVRPRVVVNAAGPWIDKVNARLGVASRLIGGTKGSHILLDHPDLSRTLAGRMIYFEANDGRICLVFDYHGRVLVGSTDIRASDPDAIACEDDEIDYFLGSLRSLLPGLAFERGQIVYTYSGIRPLPLSDGTAPGLISRDHSAPVIEASEGRQWPIFSLVGGKWTTFRGFAEEVADVLLKRLDHPRRVRTDSLPIGGGRDYPAAAEQDRWLDAISHATATEPARALQLLHRYGSKAGDILMSEGRNPVFLDETCGHSEQEITWILRNERIIHLDDVVMRRTGLAVTGRLSLATLFRISEIAAAELGWSEIRRDEELSRVREILSKRHRIRWA